jgi:hypothetical protein
MMEDGSLPKAGLPTCHDGSGEETGVGRQPCAAGWTPARAFLLYSSALLSVSSRTALHSTLPFWLGLWKAFRVPCVAVGSSPHTPTLRWQIWIPWQHLAHILASGILTLCQ